MKSPDQNFNPNNEGSQDDPFLKQSLLIKNKIKNQNKSVNDLIEFGIGQYFTSEQNKNLIIEAKSETDKLTDKCLIDIDNIYSEFSASYKTSNLMQSIDNEKIYGGFAEDAEKKYLDNMNLIVESFKETMRPVIEIVTKFSNISEKLEKMSSVESKEIDADLKILSDYTLSEIDKKDKEISKVRNELKNIDDKFNDLKLEFERYKSEVGRTDTFKEAGEELRQRLNKTMEEYLRGCTKILNGLKDMTIKNLPAN